MSEENKVSNETVVENDTENVTQDNAQNEYIAESKKYRKRAQDAETQLADLQKKLESQENAKLKQKEEYKTLAEKYEAQVNELNPYKEKYEGLVNQRRDVLLGRLPEDKRETFKNKDLDVLEFMVSELKPKSQEPSARNLVGTKNTEFGGYSSYVEWATKDPQGYEKANNTVKGRGISLGYVKEN
jgi:chromosome segregation ATPase